MDGPGASLVGSPLLELPPPLLLVGLVGSEDGGLVGSVVGDDGVVGVVGLVGVVGVVGGGFEVGGSLRGVVVGAPPPGWFGGGATTLVVGTPSAPTDTRVVGVAGTVESPELDEPGAVVGPPGIALPGSTCEVPGRVPWPPPGTFVALSAGAPGPASSATAANAVATTRPLTPRIARPARLDRPPGGGAVLFGAADTETLGSGPSGRDMQAPLRFRTRSLALVSLGPGPRGTGDSGRPDADPGGEAITAGTRFARMWGAVVTVRSHGGRAGWVR
ncbi:hypothetical protein GCM10022222_81480 [Amycolatopsis ultiminotia]|uniref:Uncharacterized protein n=1 Tax=Amycolatopsis ultiminotia TaxID=543629 RepID=A0ABP6YKS0_9PSEU